MIDLLAVYVCPKCGDVLEDQVSKVDDIDCEHDEVYPVVLCNKCNCEVRQKTNVVDGQTVPHFQQVDHERWLWATGFYDEEDDEDDFDSEEDEYWKDV